MQIRYAISKLKKTGEISQKITNKYQAITVVNYGSYQLNEFEITNKYQTNNKQITTTKEYNSNTNIGYLCDQKEKTKNTKTFQKPTVDEIKNYCVSRKNDVDANRFFDYYESKGWMIGKSKMKDWKAAVRTWENKNKGEQANGKIQQTIKYRVV